MSGSLNWRIRNVIVLKIFWCLSFIQKETSLLINYFRRSEAIHFNRTLVPSVSHLCHPKSRLLSRGLKWGNKKYRLKSRGTQRRFSPKCFKTLFLAIWSALKLCRLILGCAIKFLSVRFFQGNCSLPEFIRAFLSISRKP